MTTRDLATLRDMVLDELHPTTRYSIDGLVLPVGHTLDHKVKQSLLASAYENKLIARKANLPAWLRELVK